MKIQREKTFRRADMILPELSSKEGNGGRFYRTPEDLWVPSITTVLGHFKKKHIFAWRKRVGAEEANKISGKAARRGTKFHSMTEKYLQNVDTDQILKEASLTDYELFKNTVHIINQIDNIVVQEQTLYSKTLKVAGRCDLIAEYDGVMSVIDFKTSTKEKKRQHIDDYFEQAIAYGLMFYEMTGIPVKQFVIIMACEESVPGTFTMTTNCKDFPDTSLSLFDKIKEYHRICAPSTI